MNFKKWVKSIQTVGYNGARTVFALTNKGPSINDGSQRGEGQNIGIYLVKRQQRGREGGHKIRKMGRRCSWMIPKQYESLFLTAGKV